MKDLMRSPLLLTLAGLLLLPALAAAQATIQGTITAAGSPVAGVSVFAGDHEASTDAAGRYELTDVAAGATVLVVFKEGYRTESRDVTVPASGSLTEDFALEPDLLYSDSLVVTGTRSAVAKRESSVSITTLDDSQIAEREPRSTADLLRVIPGFYVESSGGEVGGNLWARGLPADGSYRYVALMEDGMPVFDSTELFFVNADIFIRFDENVAEMEAVRGGNAALYGSNAPGGVINLISKTGTATPQTDLKFTAGSDGLWRVGFNHRGPLAEDWNYSVGGFYRFDDGVRDPGYPASEGGQIKFNLTRNFDDGYFRIYGKYLNDSNTFYLPIPFAAGSGLDTVPGFPEDGTLHTPQANHLRAPRPNGEGTVDLSLEDGQLQEGFSLTLELTKELGDGWLLTDTARYMDIDHSWNAVVPFDVQRASDYLASFGPGATLTYNDDGSPFATPNGLVLTAGLWHVEKPMDNFSNQLQLTKAFAKHTFTVGAYTSHYTVGNTWFFNDILTDVRTQPRLLNLTSATSVSQNGFSRYGSLFVRANGDVDIMALFAGDEIQINDRLRVDIGVRVESNDFRQFDELTGNFDLGDPTTTADDAVGGGTGAVRQGGRDFDETAVSVGVNYLVNDNVAVWGRAGTGYKMPILDNFLFGGDPPVAETLTQYEVGTRIGTPIYGLNLTAYLVTVEDFPSQDARVDPDTGDTIFVTDFVGEAETTGLEAELVAEPVDNLRVSLSATLQQPEYTRFGEGAENLNGNTIRRIAEEILDLTVGYSWPRFSLSGNWNYYGDRFANNSNTIVLPSFDVSSLRAAYHVSDSTEITLAVQNLFDDIGLTEGNPRTDETSVAQGAVFLARPILPRRTTLAIDFSF